MAFYQFPLGSYAAEQPLWLNFYAADYSLINTQRTRAGVISRAFNHIKLPLPKEPGYVVQHEFGESNSNPVGPILTKAAIANAGGGIGGTLRQLERMAAPAMSYYERVFATTTYRRFSNIAEMSMISEARKQYFFQYVLVPKNAQEAKIIEQIVGSFNKSSYPTQASDLPERSYPQSLWAMKITKGNAPTGFGDEGDLTADWLGSPLVCVLNTVMVKRNDNSDSVIRLLPNGTSAVTLLGLQFTEFETGTYVPGGSDGYGAGGIYSKSEISANSI
jgi:hypothetical protein